MGSVVMSHLIGTVSLLLLFSIVGTYCTSYLSSLQSEVLANNLQDVSEYVSAEVVDLVALCSLSVEDQLLFKKLEIPKDLKGNSYNLTVARSESCLKVITQLSLAPSVFAEVLLPWSSKGTVAAFNGTDPGVNNPRIMPQVSVLSLSEDLVVWCLKSEGKIHFGLGSMGA